MHSHHIEAYFDSKKHIFTALKHILTAKKRAFAVSKHILTTVKHTFTISKRALLARKYTLMFRTRFYRNIQSLLCGTAQNPPP
jgi:hypothetical protein